jgi:hypothetical protein
MKITHFTEKAWLVTWERTSGRALYSRQYGIYGIYNDKNLAEIAIDKLQKESINNSRIDYELQEVGLNEDKELFAFHY